MSSEDQKAVGNAESGETQRNLKEKFSSGVSALKTACNETVENVLYNARSGAARGNRVRRGSITLFEKLKSIAQPQTQQQESKKPWESWPHELPTTKEFHECKLYFQIEDDAFHREMNAEIRAIAFHRIKAAIGSDCSKSAVLMAGGTEQAFALYDTDCTKCPFRQESYFQYLFGINEPDCFGILDLNAGETILFVPFVPEDAERWNGPGRPLPYFVEKYGVDHAFHTSEILEVLKERGLTSLFVNHGQNSDSDAFTDLSQIEALVAKAPQGTFSVNKEILYPILTEMRVFKTEREISLLRTSALLSSQAHVYVMRHIKPGMTELQLEALFKAWTCYYGGSRHVVNFSLDAFWEDRTARQTDRQNRQTDS